MIIIMVGYSRLKKKKKKKKKKPPPIKGTGIPDLLKRVTAWISSFFSLFPTPSLLIDSRLSRKKNT